MARKPTVLSWWKFFTDQSPYLSSLGAWRLRTVSDLSTPIVSGRHGDVGMDALHVRRDDVGSPVPTGDGSPYQQHMTAQLPTALAEDMGPKDDLCVPGLVFNGNEYCAILPFGVLPGDGPTGYHDLFPLGGAVHGGGGQDLRIEARPHELHQVTLGGRSP